MANQATEFNCQLLSSEVGVVNKQWRTHVRDRHFQWRSSSSDSSRLGRRRRSMSCPQLHENPACSYFSCNRCHPLLYPGFVGSHDLLAVSRLCESRPVRVHRSSSLCQSKYVGCIKSRSCLVMRHLAHSATRGPTCTVWNKRMRHGRCLIICIWFAKMAAVMSLMQAIHGRFSPLNIVIADMWLYTLSW